MTMGMQYDPNYLDDYNPNNMGMLNRNYLNMADQYQGGLNQNSYPNIRHIGSFGTPTQNWWTKTKSFISNPLTQMGLGGLAGSYTAFHQAKQERDAIKTQNEQVRKAISGLENQRTGVINRGTSAGTTLLNQYAISNDPRMQAGYSGMYSSNVGQVGQDVSRLGSDISKLQTMIQDVPTKDNLWANAFTGALGGVYGVGNIRNQYDQSKYYQNQYNKYYGG